MTRTGPPKHYRQLHVWISSDDCVFLQQLAESRDQTVSAVVRGLVRAERMRDDRASSTRERLNLVHQRYKTT